MRSTLFSLSPRLAACAKLVRAGSAVADIGTDHAYLPVWLVCSGRIPRAIAADINPGPLARAAEHIKKHNAVGRIEVRLSDGLNEIRPEEAQDIVIAGMGGELIARILQDCRWIFSPAYRLILQPMTRAEQLRRFLIENGFLIELECAVTDAGKLYAVLCCRYTGVSHTPSMLECWAGKMPIAPEPEASEYLRRCALRLSKMLPGLPGEEARQEVLSAIEALRLAAQRPEKEESST